MVVAQPARECETRPNIWVDDLDAGVGWALSAGATLLELQPQADVRVLRDPAEHLFCLFC